MSVINGSFKIVLPDLSFVKYLSLLSGCIILIGYASCFKEVLRRNSKLFWNLTLLFLLIYFVSFILINARGEKYDLMLRGSAFLTFAWWIPLGVFSVSIYDKQIYYDIFLRASFIMLVPLTIIYFYHPYTKYGGFGYNMFWGYSMVLPTLFHLNEFLKYKKRLYLILVIFEFAMILTYANRGVWMPIMFFIAYRYVLAPNANKTKRVLISILLITIALYIAPAFFSAISDILDHVGISSRTLELLMSGEMVSYKSGRDEIWIVSKQMILDKPLFGWGVGGEYYHLAEFKGKIADSSFHPHNGILQNMVNLGIFGGALATFIFIKPYFLLSKIKDENYYDLVLIFGCSIVANFYSASGFFIIPNCAIFVCLFYNYKKWKFYNRQISIT